MTKIYFDANAINKTAEGASWQFVLDLNGKLQIVFQKRNVLQIKDASEFRKDPPVTTVQASHVISRGE